MTARFDYILNYGVILQADGAPIKELNGAIYELDRGDSNLWPGYSPVSVKAQLEKLAPPIKNNARTIICE